MSVYPAQDAVRVEQTLEKKSLAGGQSWAESQPEKISWRTMEGITEEAQ